MIYLLTLLIQVATAASVGYVWLGHEYLTVGWGLHPTIAGALALSLIATPYLLAWYLEGRHLDQLDELQAFHERGVTTADWIKLHKDHDSTVAFKE